jgi:hypothetical protein
MLAPSASDPCDCSVRGERLPKCGKVIAAVYGLRPPTEDVKAFNAAFETDAAADFGACRDRFHEYGISPAPRPRGR